MTCRYRLTSPKARATSRVSNCPFPHSTNPARGKPVALDGLFACLFFNVVVGPLEFRNVLLAESGLQGTKGQRWLAAVTPVLTGHGREKNRTGRTKLLCSGS